MEVAVQVATRWIIAKLRNRRFFSLGELNAAIAELVTALNNRVTRHLGASRRALFDDLERSALKKLPAEPYAYAEWKECRAGLDYHVEIEKHYYSVPHALLRETMWARITARTIEVFHRGQARRRACPILIEPAAHDGARAHAVEPSALRRLHPLAKCMLPLPRSVWAARDCTLVRKISDGGAGRRRPRAHAHPPALNAHCGSHVVRIGLVLLP